MSFETTKNPIEKRDDIVNRLNQKKQTLLDLIDAGYGEAIAKIENKKDLELKDKKIIEVFTKEVKEVAKLLDELQVLFKTNQNLDKKDF
jgi:Zn-dependent M32 family carboxypeptidase